ncbi:alkylhydroperoxidase [Priestia megaterium]|nr:alkylhydroperoxidase [Priestia megaterium]
MAGISQLKFGKPSFWNSLKHTGKMMVACSNLKEVSEHDKLLSSDLKGQVKKTLVKNNKCNYCTVDGEPKLEKFDERTSIAVGFTEVFLKYPKGTGPDFAFEIIPDYEIEALKKYFTEAEISELCTFIGFTAAQQYFDAIMKLETMDFN